ncbi:hypothetical protein ElP_27830 [Tautonia plasticadhaerens]|uniref:Uncharacterized protein n=1 Tax=Tautonia plasticadhaerens TaxID=2527974 RepID=A0A518H211_9BACT|nr:hypothetical protein ElP_27830 [Tautonia plasticadhaerens]
MCPVRYGSLHVQHSVPIVSYEQGIPSDILHIARRGYSESKRHGESNGYMLAIMGGAMVWMGSQMVLRGVRMEQNKGWAR